MDASCSLKGNPSVDSKLSDEQHISLVSSEVLKENTAAALASIGVDEAASCIDVTAAQEFDIKMEKDSSDEESDGVPSDQDHEDDKKVSLLSDEEDEETASVEATVDKAVEGKATQALEPDKSTEDNLDEAPDDEDFVPGGKRKEHQKHDIQPNPSTRDGPVCLDPAVLAVGQKEKSQADHCLSKLCSKA